MNTQAQTIITETADTVSADAKALGLRLSAALAKGDTASTTVRSVMWDTVDAARSDTVSPDEAVAVLDLFVVARIAENSRAKYRQRARMVLTVAADTDAEKRETRDPLSYAASIVRAEERAEKAAKDAAERAATVATLETEAMVALGLNPDSRSDYQANLADIAAHAATLAGERAAGEALDAALAAAIASGMSRERVEAFVNAAFAD